MIHRAETRKRKAIEEAIEEESEIEDIHDLRQAGKGEWRSSGDRGHPSFIGPKRGRDEGQTGTGIKRDRTGGADRDQIEDIYDLDGAVLVKSVM
jgi:hypothetical protein